MKISFSKELVDDSTFFKEKGSDLTFGDVHRLQLNLLSHKFPKSAGIVIFLSLSVSKAFKNIIAMEYSFLNQILRRILLMVHRIFTYIAYYSEALLICFCLPRT